MIVQHMTAEAFDAYAELPENADKILEFIGGEVVEVPSNPYASSISTKFTIRIGLFNEEHDLGHVTGEAGGYMVFGERYAPDVAFISKIKQPELAQRGYNPNPPDLAIEVDFPSNYESQRNLRIKTGNYLAVGTTVWVVYPESKTVEVYSPGQEVKIVGIDGTLDGGDILPGFTLVLKEIFK
jgi:Uma2 family endonuclease